MGRSAPEGSQSVTYSETVPSGTPNLNSEVVASGTICVLDAILVDGTSDTDDVDILVETNDGTAVKKHQFQGDLTSAALKRTGFSCGPQGIRSVDGLQVDITNNDTGQSTVALTFLVRYPF